MPPFFFKYLTSDNNQMKNHFGKKVFQDQEDFSKNDCHKKKLSLFSSQTEFNDGISIKFDWLLLITIVVPL